MPDPCLGPCQTTIKQDSTSLPLAASWQSHTPLRAIPPLQTMRSMALHPLIEELVDPAVQCQTDTGQAVQCPMHIHRRWVVGTLSAWTCTTSTPSMVDLALLLGVQAICPVLHIIKIVASVLRQEQIAMEDLQMVMGHLQTPMEDLQVPMEHPQIPMEHLGIRMDHLRIPMEHLNMEAMGHLQMAAMPRALQLLSELLPPRATVATTLLQTATAP